MTDPRAGTQRQRDTSTETQIPAAAPVTDACLRFGVGYDMAPAGLTPTRQALMCSWRPANAPSPMS